MPRGDGTGPMGHGPKTGAGAGACFANQGPVNASQIQEWESGRGSGRGCGSGGGRGLRRRARGGGFLAQPSPEEEQRLLADQRDTLQEQLRCINRRLDEFKAKEAKEG